MPPRRVVKPLRERPSDWSFQERFHYAASLLGMEDREFGEFLREEDLREAPLETWLARARERGRTAPRKEVVVPVPPPRTKAPDEATLISDPASYQLHVLREELRETREDMDDLDDLLTTR